MVIDRSSLEYVRVPVAARDGGQRVDPTAYPVAVAFSAEAARPAAGDWKSAGWETDGSTFYARLLVGPGGAVELAAGSYNVWVRITAGDETPVLKAGKLVVS